MDFILILNVIIQKRKLSPECGPVKFYKMKSQVKPNVKIGKTSKHPQNIHLYPIKIL